VNPLYIGTAARRIFGIHEPAASREGRSRAAVLCYPCGTEYIYAHRSMRQLALKLSLSGYHTLRFDYFGTGDSAGDEGETDFGELTADVQTAIEALKDIAGTPKVALIGLRLGANVAANAALSSPTEVEALVLWDPILTIDLRPTLDALPDRSLILVSESRQSYEELNRSRAGSGVPVEFIDAPCPWVESATTSGALPVRIIQRIQEWLR
jgi:alpha-beta hydrolase superfamily lysophospholipase